MHHNTYENSERHFWDELTRDAHTYRELIRPLHELLNMAFGASLQPPIGGAADKWYIHSPQYGRFESYSVVACLEWLTRAIDDERRYAKEAAEMHEKE